MRCAALLLVWSHFRDAASLLEYIGPIGMLAALGVHIGAERYDLDAFGARILHQPGRERQGDASPPERFRNFGVVGDNEMRIGAAIGQFALRAYPRHLGDVAALRGSDFPGNRHITHDRLVHQSGAGMNSALSSGGSWKRPCSQSPCRQASLAASIFSFEEATKFHQI